MKKVFRYQVSGIRLASALLVLFLFTVSCLLSAKIVAQSPTPEPTPTVKEEVQEIREAVKEKVREKIEATRAGQKRAFVGKLTEIFNNTLVLDTRLGERRAQVATGAAIISFEKKIKFEGLEIGSFVISMGYLREDEILDTRRVVVTEKPEIAPERLVAFGKVTDINENTKTILVEHPKKGTNWTVEITTKTRITKKVEGKVKEVDFKDIAQGDRLVAVGTTVEGEENKITAKIIHVIPGLAVGQEKEEVTPTPEETED